MNNKTKTKLQFILGAILMLTFAVAGCNDSKTDKTVTTDSLKTTVPIIDTTMDDMPADSAPTPGGGG